MTMSFLAPLPTGTVLQQRYRVGRAIGHGGMGAVYEAIDQRLNARVALKQILRATPTLRQAFEHEAKLLANLRHPGLPRVNDYFSESDADFIVMEYIDGQDLAEIVHERGPLEIAEVLAWADQLLDVVQHLHGYNPQIIHRDIKPQNIKLTKSGMLVLLDFGIAKGNLGAETTTSGGESVAAWTPQYAPPEQILRGGTDERSDLFSLAATLYHLLSNQKPVPADQRMREQEQGKPDPLLPVARVNARVPVAVSDLIHQAMARKMEHRPASAAIFRERLRAAASGQAAAPVDATELGTVAEDESASSTPQPGGSTGAGAASLVIQHTAVPVPPPAGRPAPGPPISPPSGGTRGVPPTLHGQLSLQKRIHALVHQVLDSYDGAWMVWCDLRGDWRPLLERVAADSRLGGFELITVTDATAGELGGLTMRRLVQERLDARASFVLLAPVEPARLGWLWAQALLAEKIYATSLFDQLVAWGWRPPSPTVTADEAAALARQGLQQDPAAWGGGGLQPDVPLLLDVLAGGATPEPDEAYILDRTVEATGLPALDLANLARWRARALAHLLVTQAHTVAPRLVHTAHELLLAEPQRPLALDLLTRWCDSLRLSRRLPELIAEADRVADLGGNLREATVKYGPFISRAAEQAVFASSCARLSQKSGKELLQALADMEADLARHALGFWGDRSGRTDPGWAPLAIPWGELLRLSGAAQSMLVAAPARDWAKPDDAVRWYTEGGWRLDAAGEEILRNLARSTPELITVITPLRETYRMRWEKTLIQWSDVWAAAGSPAPSLPTAGTWLRDLLAAPRPTAILVIDALRYDLGVTLAEQVNCYEGAVRASVRAARAPLPSVTALGMGMALPISEADLRAEVVDGSWQLIERSTQLDLSVAENRRAWLRERFGVPPEQILALADVIRGTIPTPAGARARLVITDATIDQLGHDDELERLGSGIALGRYREAIIRLRDSGWLRILIVTDHGYIHWSGSDERRQQPPVAGPAYRSRRALAYPAGTVLKEPHGLAPGGQWKVVPSPGAACWSAYGGLGYFHGGASLQEWVIPCVQIDWPLKAQPVHISLQPLERVLSQQPRVMLTVERGSLFLEDALPRHIDVIIRHRESRAILFRSAQIEVTPDQTQLSIPLRLAPGALADWEAPLRIELRDGMTEDVLDTGDSVLRVQLDDW